MSDSLQPHRQYPARLLSMEFSRQEYWIGLPFSSPEIFLIQGLNPGLPHCRQILYHLSYQGSPRILAWVAYPFSRGLDLGIKLGSPSLQVDSLPAELPGKPQSSHCTSLSMQLFFIVEKLLLQFLDCIPGKNYSGANCRSFEDANKNSQRIEINGIIGKC